MIQIIKQLNENGNTLIVVEHNLNVILAGDNIIEIGPEAGLDGGEIIYNGTSKGLLENKNSLTKEDNHDELSSFVNITQKQKDNISAQNY